MWAFASLGVPCPALLRDVQRQFEGAGLLAFVSAPELATLAWGFVTLGFPGPLEAIEGRARQARLLEGIGAEELDRGTPTTRILYCV